MNSAPIIADWQFAALLSFSVVGPAILCGFFVISERIAARRRRLSWPKSTRPNGSAQDMRFAARYYDAAVRCSRSGEYALALRYSRLASELLGLELAAPVSLALGGVR